MRVPDRMLNCVGFVAHDEVSIKYGGTAFLVAVPGDLNNAYLHLVTAQHVAEMVEHGPFIVGMNNRQGAPVQLKGGGAKWFYHPTEKDSVDVAVTPFAPNPNLDLDVEWIPEKLFALPDRIAEYGIGIGDEISVAGLFTRFHGASKHFPIVRTGNIAMMPTDKVPVKGFSNMDAYLAEGRSIGGLSGSPVFVRNSVQLPPTKSAKGDTLRFMGYGPLHFLGLMHGHWDLPPSFNKTEQAEAVNMGISIIVPAKKILEVLYHPELVQMRKKFDAKRRVENLPTPDSELSKKPTFTKQDFETALKKASRKTGTKK
jgi:hypothetical protein